MTELLLIGAMAGVTFLIRYTLFAVAGRLEFPDYLVRALRYVPPTILTAITVPAILFPAGDAIFVSYANAYLVGGLAAFGVGWFSRNLLVTIVAGMVAFWGWQSVLALLSL